MGNGLVLFIRAFNSFGGVFRLSGIRRPFLFVLVSVCLAAATGCGLFGGGGEESADLGLIDFGPPAVEDTVQYQLDQAKEHVVQGLTYDPERLIEVSFAYSHELRLENLEQGVRDLLVLMEYENPADVNLDWVKDVHRAVAELDHIFAEAVEYDLPPEMVEEYGEFYIEMLDVIQIAGYGASRALGAAIVIGPDGRTLLNLEDPESDRFRVLLREASFYLEESSTSMEDINERMSGVLSSLSTSADAGVPFDSFDEGF